MKNLLRRLLGLTILVALGLLLWKDFHKNTEIATLMTDKGKFDFRVEIADNPISRAQGLMHRKEMAEDAGMLFLNDEDRMIEMWMKNTYIPLDMIFLSADGTVKHIAKNTTPLSEAHISSQVPVRAVLEVPAGTSDRIGAKEGDKLLTKRMPDAPH